MADSGGYVRFETMLIGGGQAGLAAGHHLAWRERSVMISDAGRRRIGRLLARGRNSLSVFTPAREGGLPGWSFSPPGRSYPTMDEMGDYLEVLRVGHVPHLHPAHVATRLAHFSRAGALA